LSSKRISFPEEKSLKRHIVDNYYSNLFSLMLYLLLLITYQIFDNIRRAAGDMPHIYPHFVDKHVYNWLLTNLKYREPSLSGFFFCPLFIPGQANYLYIFNFLYKKRFHRLKFRGSTVCLVTN